MNKLLDLLWQELSLASALAVSLCLSMLFVASLLPLDFLMGHSSFFDHGDAAQHISGIQAYLADEWRFPLLHTERLSFPEGTNIAFTDSLPLVAISLKPFSGLLPQGFHYLGLWQGASYILLAIAGVIALRCVGQKSLIATISATFFFMLSSVLMWRMGHTALMTQCLVVFSFANYLNAQRNPEKINFACNLQIALLLASFLIHPYFLAINAAFFLVLLLLLWQTSSTPYRAIAIKLAYFLGLLLLIVYTFGYLGHNSKASGFGVYSFNLAAPFCGGYFLHCSFDGTGGQGEGFAYLGLGILGLLSITMVYWCSKIKIIAKPHLPMLLMIFSYVIYALSNHIYLGDHLLFDNPLLNILKPLSDTFRASGRFFWPAFYGLIFIALLGILTLKWRMLSLLLLLSAGTLQWFDLSHLRQGITERAKIPSKLQLEDWAPVAQKIEAVIVFPPYDCGDMGVEQILKYQRIALAYQKTINSAQAARALVSCEEKIDYIAKSAETQSLFVIPFKVLQKSSNTLPDSLKHLMEKSSCGVTEAEVLCIKDVSQQWWLDAGFKLWKTQFKGQQAQLIAQYPASSLPTLIGSREETKLHADGSRAGFLSYGPYLQLAAGHYVVNINYQSKSNNNAVVGRWDITPVGSDTLISGDLHGTLGKTEQITATFTFDESLQAKPIEVRTRVTQDHETTLNSIDIRKVIQAENQVTSDEGL